MKTIRIANKHLAFSFVVSCFLVFGGQGLSSAHEPDARSAGHIVLGDSIECGVVLDIGSPNFGIGYVRPLHNDIESLDVVDMDLVNLCVLGATTRDINFDQLPQAIAEISSHDQIVVSIGGGGNNLRRFITSPQAVTCAMGNVSCLTRINALLNEAEQNLRLTLKTLRAVMGEESLILIRTQYNALMGTSILGTACADPELTMLGTLAIVGGVRFLQEGFNDRIRRVAAEYGAVVAEIFNAFAADPETLISGDCTHPTQAGYDVIHNAFIDAL